MLEKICPIWDKGYMLKHHSVADILDMDRLHRLHEPCVCNSGFIVKKNWLDKLLEWLTQW